MDRINFSEDRISFIAVFVVLFLFWILVSSAVDSQHILVGIVAAFIVSHFSSDLLIGKSKDIPSLKAVPLFLSYLVHLGVEIVTANLTVARIVLDPKLPISPSIIKFKTQLKTDTAKATLANSITLTPGTLTIDIKGDTFYVHTLTREDANEVKRWHMEKRLLEVEDAA
jgi:multicomponent Na+:H+ antiporter subunit E